MSIIAEALKRAEKEKEKQVNSKAYMNKTLGPTRKETYKKEVLKTDVAFEGVKLPDEKEQQKRSRALIAVGGVLVLAIAFLAFANIFLLPSFDVGMLASEESGETDKVPLVAEAYSNMNEELALIESRLPFGRKKKKALTTYLARQKFLANFTLNGIVYDVNDSWAIINNRVVRVGDIFDGVKVVSIEQEKVVLGFKDETFDLVVK